jgi:hypothetical protein
MIDYRRLAIALAACMFVAGVISGAAAMGHHVFLPFVHGAAIRTTGQVFPPNGLHCLLQQGTSRVIDPRTDTEVFSCEDVRGGGQIVWTGRTLLLKHVATGSGSLSVTDGVVYITAVREDGALEVQEVPAK